VNNQPRGGTTLLPASITVTRLSEVLGLTREHCSRIVASLVHEGVLEKDGRQIAVNRDALEAEPASRISWARSSSEARRGRGCFIHRFRVFALASGFGAGDARGMKIARGWPRAAAILDEGRPQG
jgi:hypothetical protein